MNKYILIAITLVTLSSCKKWLDVKPVSQVSADEMFKTPDGFQDALNGIYSSCTNQNLYGYELTCGLPEVLAQNYYIIPEDYLHYKQTAAYNYRDPYFMAKKDTVWTGLYHGIANCNLILQNVETNKSVLTGDMYALIKAEALAMRGYLHFDLLRLFAPSFKSNPNAKAIPYVTDFSNKVTALSTVTEVLNNVATDLSQAKDLIRPVDPILSASYVPSYATDSNGHPSEQQNPNLFLQNRRHRMNYYAICGELARVNLYREKMSDALGNALEVINSNKFPWIVNSDFNQTDTKKKDRIMYKELLFAWYVPNMKDTLAAKFNAGVNSLVIDVDAGDAIYEKSTAGARDFRPTNWLLPSGATYSPKLYELQKYKRDPETNLYNLVLPAMRLSEMYYIASESSYDVNPTQSVEYLNLVRRNRGGMQDVVVNSKDQLIQELIKEERKETYGEGQIFYMYKRLNTNFPNLTGGAITASDKLFVMPLPNDEIEFGNR
ncbi:hypothetical protein A4D02_23920 [Niastella koreensis]|uniref:RagB/SusD domain-containing protein n=2 Tax=Niastella koreensis TaxID=354356 RepID=G8TC71_NIAKG|nr:RagB/SusD family nutrient uptake outer membrane protein [Niastella koreensis]AEW00378.1 hypothetical protein Niako_4099 [Niastella koreensis GR20-10]OQP52245.1 hypothetical protein A4D02_23920 [Niastella koreensis]